MRATTRENSEVIATGLRTIFTRIQRPEAIENLRQLGIVLQYTREEAERLGNIKLTGQFVGPVEAFKRVGSSLKDVQSTDPRFIQVAEEIGGYRQINQVIPLIQQQKLAQDALNVANATSTSLTANAEKGQNSLANRIQKTTEQFLLLGRNLLADQGFRQMIELGLKLANVFISVVDSLKPLVPLLVALAAVRIGQSLAPVLGGVIRGTGLAPQRYAGGGVVPGVGNSDTHHALLTPGEFVIKQDSARKIGYDRREELNRFADNHALLSDAVAHSVGHRVLGSFTGFAVAQTAAQAETKPHYFRPYPTPTPWGDRRKFPGASASKWHRRRGSLMSARHRRRLLESNRARRATIIGAPGFTWDTTTDPDSIYLAHLPDGRVVIMGRIMTDAMVDRAEAEARKRYATALETLRHT